MAPLRVLCLHGWRTSAGVLQQQTQALQRAFGERAEFVFVDAPHAASGPADEAVRLLYARHAPFYQWWDAVQVEAAAGERKQWRYDGFQLSLDLLVGRVHALGAVDVVLGFSQGAACAAMLSAHFRHTYGRVPWRVCVFASGFLPRTPETKHLFEDAFGDPRRLDVASVHLIGKQDPRVANADKLFEHCAPSAGRVKFVHEEGHRFPSLARHREMYDEIADTVVALAASGSAARF